MTAVRILLVCTMNQCRSPIAAALLRGLAEDAGVPLVVQSAGFGPSGVHAQPAAVKVMSRRRYRLDGHVSTRVTPTMLTTVDLIITMERRHVQELVALSAASWPRTFALRDLVERVDAAGPRGSGQSPLSWLQRLHDGRLPAGAMSDGGLHDIADPTGGPRRGYAATRDDLQALLGRFVLLLQGREPDEPPPRRGGLLRRLTPSAP